MTENISESTYSLFTHNSSEILPSETSILMKQYLDEQKLKKEEEAMLLKDQDK